MSASQRMEPADPRAKAIEAMARAMYEDGSQQPRTWDEVLAQFGDEDGFVKACRFKAKSVLAALEQEGLVLTDTREDERELALVAALAHMADIHHRTLTGSRLHDPERIVDFTDCGCLTCRFVADTLTAYADSREALSSVPAPPATREEESTDA